MIVFLVLVCGIVFLVRFACSGPVMVTGVEILNVQVLPSFE